MNIKWAIFLISWAPVGGVLLVGAILGMNTRDVQGILMGLVLIPTLIFLVRYARMRWWRHIAGRNMIGISLVMAVYLTVALLVRIFERPDWYGHFFTVILALLTALMWQRNLMLTLAQHEVAEEERAARSRLANDEGVSP